HTDGLLYYLIITTISYGSHTLLEQLKPEFSFLLERRSLLVL
ncbi:GSCOCG00005346001-RA-CDS, partial [Cotesia congregata]